MNTGTPSWNGLELIALGSNRACVFDPHDRNHCLKFELPPAGRKAAGLRNRLRRQLATRLPRGGANQAELRAWQSLHARLGEDLGARMARVQGLVATGHGQALRCQCLLLDEREPARSLFHHLFVDRCHPAEELCAAVDRFEAWLLEHRIPLFDLNAGNFVVVPRDGRLELVCVDAKSVVAGKELLPVSRWSTRLLQAKVRRRAQRLRQRIRAALAGAPALAEDRRPH